MINKNFLGVIIMNWSMLCIWIIISVLAIFLDIFTSAGLFVWFAIGAFAAMIALTCNAVIGIQILVFSILSILGLIIGYPIVKRIIKKSIVVTKTMEQEYIGREYIAEEKITSKANIKVDGIYWTAKNKGGTIDKGEKYKIVGIDKTKLVIKPSKEVKV